MMRRVPAEINAELFSEQKKKRGKGGVPRRASGLPPTRAGIYFSHRPMNPSDVPAAAPLGGAPKAVPALPNAVPEKLLAARGKIAAAPFAEFSPAAWKSAGAVFADGCGVALGTSVFENVSAPLAAAGTPWDAARERIARELAFWFGSEEFSAVPAENLSAEQRTRLALARAFAGKPAGAPLAVAGTLPHLAPLTDALKIRAKKENIAVVVETAPEKIFRAADLLAFFPDTSEAASGGVPAFCSPQEAESAPPTLFAAVQFRSAKLGGEPDRNALRGNVFSGKILGTGAGEFFAELHGGAQIRGRLCGNAAGEDVPAETEIDVFLPPEIFRADAFPPEENFFELESGGEIFSAGALHFRRFATKGEAFAPLVASQFRQALEIPVGGALFAWFFPEDALGFLKTPPATAG